jgi:hypothetical protein
MPLVPVHLPYRQLHGLEDAQYNFEWVETHWPTVTGAPPTGAAGGDLTGSYPNPTVVKRGIAGISNVPPVVSGATGGFAYINGVSFTVANPAGAKVRVSCTGSMYATTLGGLGFYYQLDGDASWNQPAKHIDHFVFNQTSVHQKCLAAEFVLGPLTAGSHSLAINCVPSSGAYSTDTSANGDWQTMVIQELFS